MRIALTAVLLLLLATVPTQPAAAASFTVTATNLKWTPSSLAVAVGDTVTFTNGGGSHSWVSTSGMGSCSLPCTKTFASIGTFSYRCGVHSSMTGSVTVGGLPEIAISAPLDGATVSGSFVASGSAWSEGSTMTSVVVRLGSQPVQTAAFAGAEWSATINTLPVANGVHNLTVAATNSMGRTSERAVSVLVENPATVDLLVGSLSSTTSGPTNVPIITLAVKNEGNVASASYHVRAEYQYRSVWRLIAEPTAGPVPAKSTTQLTISWEAPPGSHVGRYPIRVTIDSFGVVPESNEANNVGSTTASWFTNQVSGLNPSEP